MHELVFQIYHQKNAGTISFLYLKLLCVLLLVLCMSIFYLFCVCSHACGYPWRPGEANSMELELQAAVSCYPIQVVGSELKSSARAVSAPTLEPSRPYCLA